MCHIIMRPAPLFSCVIPANAGNHASHHHAPSATFSYVIPANAGNHVLWRKWIPAFAGMTEFCLPCAILIVWGDRYRAVTSLPVVSATLAASSGSFLNAPRMFSAASAICSAINACAPSCQPHTIHSALLARNTQNPAPRRRLD